MGLRNFEDLEPGMVFWGDEVVVDREEMLAFAGRFDPQPMHLDDESAKAIGLDGAIASGSFTMALGSLSMQTIVNDELNFLPGGLGFEMTFSAPVYAADRLRLRVEIVELTPSNKPGRGFVRTAQVLLNHDQVTVLEIKNTWVIASGDDADR